MPNQLRIGTVAERTGVSIDTVRFYERRGLLPAAPRTANGYRVFTAEAIERLHFIKQAQEIGFSLDEISILLSRNEKGDCRAVHDLLDAKLKQIDNHMKTMVDFRENLVRYLAECVEELRKHPDSAECPVVDEIAHAESK